MASEAHLRPLSYFDEKLPSSKSLSPSDSYPVFVTYNTIHKDSRRLRGCIGTFSASPLESALKQYAVIAALKDTRFQSIKKTELDSLEACVSILTDFEDIDDPLDWNIGQHGLQIYFTFQGRPRSATFLPDVAKEQGWSKDTTMDQLFRKGGWDGTGSWRDIEHVDVQRYQSTKSALRYDTYKKV